MGEGRARAAAKDCCRSAHRRARNQRHGGIGDTAVRRGQAPLERRSTRSRSRPRSGSPPAAESTAIGQYAGDQPPVGVGVVGPGPLSVVLGPHVGRSVRGAARLPGRPGTAPPRLLPRTHGRQWAVRFSAAGSLRWLRDIVGGTTTTARWQPRGSPPARRAHAACRPSARAMFEGLSLRLRAAHWSVRCWRTSRTACATSLELLKALGVEPAAQRRRRHPQRALAEDRRLGARPPDYGAALRAASRPASSPRRRRRSTRVSACVTRSRPTPTGSLCTTRATSRSGPYPRDPKECHDFRRESRVHHWGQRRIGAAESPVRCTTTALRSAWRRAAVATSVSSGLGVACRSPRSPGGRGRRGRRNGRAVRWPRHRGRKRRRRRVPPSSSSFRASTSRRWSTPT